MFTNVTAYKSTSIDWAKSQAQIMKLLEDRGIKETRFTNISFETAQRAGFDMKKGTSAIMLEFFRPTQVASGVGGTIPIRIIIPNIPEEERAKRQAYRIFYWYLKTKFEAVETGLIEFEQEFMPHIALGKGGVMTNMWQQFKKKMLPSIVSGERSDIALLTGNKEDNTN
jgi:hypothetical protein